MNIKSVLAVKQDVDEWWKSTTSIAISLTLLRFSPIASEAIDGLLKASFSLILHSRYRRTRTCFIRNSYWQARSLSC